MYRYRTQGAIRGSPYPGGLAAQCHMACDTKLAPCQRQLPTTEELEGKELPAWAEPYGQAGAQAATTMRMTREIDRQALRLEYECWDMQEVEDLCLMVLQRVRDDTEARTAAGQKPQVSTSPPHLVFELRHRRREGLQPPPSQGRSHASER